MDQEKDTILDKLISALAVSTRSPKGKYTSVATYPLLAQRLFPKHLRRFSARHMIAAAAVVIVLLIPAWLYYRQTTSEEMKCFYTHAQRGRIQLPDGTTVMLNHFSSLTYAKNFSRRHREVHVDGEAYFEVTKDKKHPFVVKTSYMNIKVLGTHFDINAYRGNPTIQTILLEGSVAVTCQRYSALLKPGEMAVYDKEKKALKQMEADNLSDMMAWQQGFVIFSHNTIEEVAQILSNHFGKLVTVVGGKEVEHQITVRFSHGEGLQDILSVLKEAGYINYTIHQNHISITTTDKRN